MTYQIETKKEFENFVLANWNMIDHYLRNLQSKLPTPIYSSVDIRESIKKFAAIDHNLYPAGFNNICSVDLENSSQVFK